MKLLPNRQGARRLRWVVGAVALTASLVLVAPAVDTTALGATGRAALGAPVALVVVLSMYAAAFLLRAALWRRLVPDLPLGQSLAAIHVSLAGNHILPLRLGEALRVTSVLRRTAVRPDVAVASTVTLRAADVLAVALIAAVSGPVLASQIAGRWALPVLGLITSVGAAGCWWLWRLSRRRAVPVRLPGLVVGAGCVAAWALESAVVWQAAVWAGIRMEPSTALFVTAVTICAQTVAVAPGGFGTYEAAATAALVSAGAEPGAALAAALVAHAVKSGYALVAGAAALCWPAPGLLGRLRLPRGTPASPRPAAVAVPAGAPVVLFFPAHNEADAVGGVVRRVPATVHGRPVVALVIDDGSEDQTAAVAAAAGAVVLRLPAHLGLGAAVRLGLAEACALQPAAVAFCDADGEYAPEELDRMVAPVLAGEADYVVGSRFTGDIRRMLPHRRVGNQVLTRLLAFAARAPLTDGQSGYRALSPTAAGDADVVHDFNYAQVLTLDLLAKGWRYAEVPITYTFRTTGSSFVRLGRYLRHVAPAVHRVLNPPLEPQP